jgi:alkanesulfonate monooxygenase SsuD/methylene tetrahydromethanopterin reductase-like flavin-dependent oxidoreductase (luciferase family)
MGDARSIRVGLRITTRASSAASALAALPALAQQSEALGFELLVVPERLSAEGGAPAALPACAAAAAVTERIRIATGLLALPLHHPLRVAEDAATLDALSGGRFELGVGLGAEVEAFAGFGLDSRERAARFEEALEVVRRAWAPGPVRFLGRHFRCDELEVHPKPVQAGGPPLWLGARSPDALARAALLEVGVVLEADTDPGPYLAAWRGAGAPRVAFLLDAEAGPNPELAALAARLAQAGEAETDVWLGCAEGAAAPGLAALAERLRALG